MALFALGGLTGGGALCNDIFMPAFDKIAYLYKIIEEKNKQIVVNEFAIFAADQAIPNIPKEDPNRERNIEELKAQQGRFQDQINAWTLDIQNLEKFIEKTKRELELQKEDPAANTKS